MQVIYKGERKKFFNYDYTNLIEEFHVQISLPGTYLCLLSILILYCIYCRRYPCHLLIASSYKNYDYTNLIEEFHVQISLPDIQEEA